MDEIVNISLPVDQVRVLLSVLSGEIKLDEIDAMGVGVPPMRRPGLLLFLARDTLAEALRTSSV